MGLVVFIAVIGVLVLVHEWGHYITAVKLGVRIEKFAIGFGPKLFSFTRGGTEFMVCAIPLGGYVKPAGEDRSKCTGDPGELFSRSVGDRALIVVMGPVVNAVFAYLCFYFTFVAGYPIIAAKIGGIMEDMPAQVAGLQVDDKIIEINDQPIEQWEDLQKSVMDSRGAPLTVRIERGEQEMVKVITPATIDVEEDDPDFDMPQRWLIGIEPKAEVAFVKHGAMESFGKAFHEMGKITYLTFRELSFVVSGAKPAKDALAGPIGIFDLISQSLHIGFTYLVYIMAVISLSLAIFNLFPIPVLDGGHLFMFALEKLRNKPLPVKVEEGLTRVGFSLLMCLLLFVLYNDIVKVGWIENIKKFVEKHQPAD